MSNVLTVPMRNGNREMQTKKQHRQKVLTVPMRNGNRDGIVFIDEANFGSYRTYEEWKQYISKYTFCHSNTVLTVPMRNGNGVMILLAVSGVDVGSYRTYEEWKPFLSILFHHRCFVLTVPMRNGNPCCEMIVLRSSSGSYRTYEEWKHSALIGVTVLNVWFLPYL